MTLLVLTIVFVIVGLAAIGFGADSREPMTDDHLR
jgi:hypothetical protein